MFTAHASLCYTNVDGINEFVISRMSVRQLAQYVALNLILRLVI